MTTYSTSLKITLPGDGQDSGTWGQVTNNNLGTLLEQAITGYVAIDMADANVTLTNLNGTFDQARNAVLELTGTNSAVRDVIPPVVEKLYTIVNNTSGGYAIRVIGATGTGVSVPNGATVLVYCNGTNFYPGLSGTSGSFIVNGTVTATNAVATNNVTATSHLLGNNATITNTLSSANIAATSLFATTSNATTFNGTTANVTTVNATTVNGTTTNATNLVSSNVAITGGSITGITDLSPADGGTGQSSYTDGQLLIGNSTGNTLTKATLTAGSGISITNGAGSIALAATEFISASSNTANSGYITFSNGLIMQWGKVTGTASSQSISFPITFPTNVVSITSQFATTGTSGSSSWAVNSYTTSGFVFVTGNPGQTTFWFAVGY